MTDRRQAPTATGPDTDQGDAASTTRVLVVDDDPHIVRTLRINLAAHGFHVTTASDGAAALRAATATRPDVVVLDLGLPDQDGLRVLIGLRGWSNVPVIVLSARTDSSDKVSALEAGADDYVTKPFGMAEFIARLRAAVRRSTTTATMIGDGERIVEFGSVSVDLYAKRVSRAGENVHLTPTEWGILETLIRHRGRLVPQRELLRTVWGPQYQDRANYLRVYIGQLRRKLENDPGQPRYLITEAGMGHRLEI